MDFTKALVVDNNLRTISIPQSVPLLGVTHDNDVHEIFFVIPVSYNDVDLSGYTVNVNWMNAGGEIGVAETTEETSEDETVMIRKWTVGDGPCKYAGECQFILCLKSGEYEYNTQRASLPVYSGIETDDVTIEKYQSALAELVERIQFLAGKYAWNGTTWENFVKYDTISNICKTSARLAEEYATKAQSKANEIIALGQTIESYFTDISDESVKITEIYNSISGTGNPNICPLAQLKTNSNSTSGIINGNTQMFGHVMEGEQYVFSADVVWSPQPARIEMRLKKDDGSGNVSQLAYINSGTTGRFHETFIAPASGQIWFSATMGASDPGTLVWDYCQLERGVQYSDYQPYGHLQVVDAEARTRLGVVEEKVEAIDPFTSHIISVAHQGYSGYGATKNTLQAFKDAKKYGFDWIETDVYATADGVMLISHDGKVDTATETNVDVWTVNYADIISPTLLYSDAVNTCSMHGIGMAIELKGTHFNKNRGDYIYLINQVETKNVPHAFFAYNISNLKEIRTTNRDQEVVLLLNSKPTATEIMTESTYGNFYAILQQGGKVAIFFPFANNPIDQEYVDSLAQIGCGLIAGATETESTLAQYMKFCRMEVTDTILAKDIVQEYYP